MMFIPSTAVGFMGWLEEWKVNYKIQSYLIQVHFVLLSNCILMLFEDRYDVLVAQNSSKRKRVIYHLINLIFGCCIILPIYFEKIDNDKERMMISAKYPEMPPRFFEKQTHVVTTQTNLAIILVFIETILMTSQLLYFPIHTIFYLTKKSSQLSEHTREMQLRFVISLILQVCIPVTVLALPIMFNIVVIYLGIHNQIMNNTTLLIMSTHGFFASLCVIYNHEPYRKFTIRLFLCLTNRIEIEKPKSTIIRF
ncbi:unnamed protein product [Caenorhabditis angaria]|uniref:Serpentine Receptor, class H n=1 Tax=Caenorhabditis angaria TaxID=860376 RepID=A0A9P1N9Z1_9PELO|nr:unnamed protein product [Caenorhabditis angaria]